jgi:hypothetical protein
VAVLCPAVSGDSRAAGIEPKYNLTAEFCSHLSEPFKVAYGFRADYHPFDSYIEQLFYGGFVAQSATDFDFEQSESGYRRDGIGVDRLAELGAIKVYYVEPLSAGFAELAGLLYGVILVVYLAVVVALDEPNTFFVAQVDCRYYVHNTALSAEVAANINYCSWKSNRRFDWGKNDLL